MPYNPGPNSENKNRKSQNDPNNKPSGSDSYKPWHGRRERKKEGKYTPLTAEQQHLMIETAEAGDTKDELIVKCLLHLGLRADEFAHMRADWVQVKPNGDVDVVIPAEDVCTGGNASLGKNNSGGANPHDRGDPCHKCRQDHRSGKWKAKTDNSPRTITVPDQWTNPYTGEKEQTGLPELLQGWFTLNDQIPMTGGTVNNRIRRMLRTAEIDRDCTAHDFRNTYGINLASKNFDRWAIRDLMGHGDTRVADDYIKYSGRRGRQNFERKY